MRLNHFFILLMIIFISVGCDSKIDKKNSAQLNSKHHESIYNSVTEIADKIIAKGAVKTNRLEITKIDNILHLKIDVYISPELKKLLNKTNNKFYFNISDALGKENLQKAMSEKPFLVEGNLIKLQNKDNTDIYTITQEVKIKSTITSVDMKELLKPENYEFEFSDHNGQIILAIIGLELDSIQ